MNETSRSAVDKEAPRDLVREAAELRRSLRARLLQEAHRGPGILYRLLVLVVLAAVLGGAFSLLLMESLRRQAVEQLASLVVPEAGGFARVYPLPPPPPEPAVPKMATALPPSVASGGEVEGVLYATIPGPEQSGSPAESQQTEFQQAPKSPGAELALARLREFSRVATAILEGSDERYEFVEWRLVRSNPPSFWLDLVVKDRSDESEVHLVYEVDIETGRVRPLSQAARDLSR